MLHYLAYVLTGINVVAIIICIFLVLMLCIVAYIFADCIYGIYEKEDDEYKIHVRYIRNLMLAIAVCLAIIILLPNGEAFLTIAGMN